MVHFRNVAAASLLAPMMAPPVAAPPVAAASSFPAQSDAASSMTTTSTRPTPARKEKGTKKKQKKDQNKLDGRTGPDAQDGEQHPDVEDVDMAVDEGSLIVSSKGAASSKENGRPQAEAASDREGSRSHVDEVDEDPTPTKARKKSLASQATSHKSMNVNESSRADDDGSADVDITDDDDDFDFSALDDDVSTWTAKDRYRLARKWCMYQNRLFLPLFYLCRPLTTSLDYQRRFLEKPPRRISLGLGLP